MLNRTLRALLLLALVLIPAPRVSAGEVVEDRWYVIELMDQRSGWMRSLVERTEDGNIATTTTLSLEISRGQMTIPIEMTGVFVETPGGEPVSMRSVQRLGQAPMESEWVFTDGRDGPVEMTSLQFGNEMEQNLPAPQGEWTTPFAASERVARLMQAGETTITTRTIDPTIGLTVIETTATVKGEEAVEAMGRVIPAVEWEVVTSAAPGLTSIEYVNANGDPIRSEVNFGGLRMTTVLADRELALSELDPAEIMVSTFVKPSREIDRPRDTERAVYRLTLSGGGEVRLAETSAQSWTRDGDSVELTVVANPSEMRPALIDDVGVYLASTSTADLDDPEIESLLARALDGVERADDVKRAERLRRFVHGFIDQKSLAVGFATASEVCRTRQGDCSEHGVLLTALLRGAGIPSRVASGLIYADAFAGERAIFGYHMWSQALLEIDGERRWVDLDATLPDSVPFDATHIALAVSDLSDGETFNTMAALAPALGRLRIEVVSVE